MLGRLRQQPARVDDEFVWCTRIEASIALRRVVEVDDFHVDDFRDRKSIPENCLHQLSVVSQHRGLAGVETVRFGPTEAEPEAQLTVPRGFIPRSWILRHIKSRD